MTHYSQPMNWTEEKLATAAANLHTFKGVGVRGLGLNDETDLSKIPEISNGKVSEGLIESLADDLNTSSAIFTHLFSLVRTADQPSGMLAAPSRQLLIDCMFLGIDPFRYTRQTEKAYREHKGLDRDVVDRMVADRTAARARKDFAESDRIRDQLAAMGVAIKDSKEGTTWEIAR
jgi:cysteinyl-tRNA synthetase